MNVPLAFDAKIVFWQVRTRSLAIAKLPPGVFWWSWLVWGLGDHLVPTHHTHAHPINYKVLWNILHLKDHHLKLYPPYLWSFPAPVSLLQPIVIIVSPVQIPSLAPSLSLLWSELSLSSNIHDVCTPKFSWSEPEEGWTTRQNRALLTSQQYLLNQYFSTTNNVHSFKSLGIC